ncbi:hypothetical protein [Pseudescherichia sp.]|uniref:hypothetical protein n=1 Tax=Pseudescherichia sp. TaxID=2055881 RepID=UPI0028A1C136|nr:hypothetical protein [Pseudescherichia sp.]
MSSVSILAPLGIGLLAWAIAGCTISSNMQEKNNNKLMSRLSGTLGGAVVGFICLIASIIYFDDSSTESTTNTVSSASTSKNTEGDNSAVDSVPKKSIGINVETLTKRMQKNLVDLGSKFKVHFDTEKNENSTLSKQELNDHNAVLITSDNATGMITSMMIITMGNGSMQSGFDVLHTVLSTVSATLGDNEMKSGKSADIVMGLVKHKYPNDEVFVDGKRYSILQTNEGLITFFISAK